MDGSYVSVAEQQTYLRFLKFGQREDSRNAFDYRDWRVFYTKETGSCVVYLGNTTVMCSVKVVPKRTQKPNQSRGLARVDVAISSMSYSKFVPGRQRLRTLRKQLRQHIKSSVFWSKCVDDESLCIARGKAIFLVQIGIDVIHADGNLFDASCLAAVACLLNTQRPEILVEGSQITALSMYEKTPIPLQVNHIPVSTTFGLQPASHFIIMDPSGREEVVLNGTLTIVVNQNGEVCATYKRGIAALPLETIQRCTEIAALRARDVASRLREISEADAANRSKNVNMDFLANLRRQSVQTSGDRPQSALDASLRQLTQNVFAEHVSAVILPKSDERRVVPGAEQMSDQEEGQLGDEDDWEDESEEDTEILESRHLE